MAEKIQNFTQLLAWQKSHELVVEVYEVCKKIDRFSPLRTQMERSSISITSNIVEGFGRQSIQDKKHFYIIARGSGYELRNQLIIAKDIGSISEADYIKLSKASLDSTRLLHGLIRSMSSIKEPTNS